jgi:hypothetical protein
VKYFFPTHKKEQKTLLRLKFTAKNPQREHNTRLAKVAVQYSAETFVLYSKSVLRIGICGQNATFAKRGNVGSNANEHHTLTNLTSYNNL